MKSNSGAEEMDMDMRWSNFKADRGAGNRSRAHASFHMNAQGFLSRRQRKEWLLRMSFSQRAYAAAREIMTVPVVLDTHQLLETKAEPSPLPERAAAVCAEEAAAEVDTKRRSNKSAYSEDWLTVSTILGLDDPFHPARENLQRFLLQEKAEAISEAGSAGWPDYESKRRKLFGEKKGNASWKIENIEFQRFRVPLVASLVVCFAFLGFLVGTSWWMLSERIPYGIGKAFHETSESRAPVAADQGNQSVGMTIVKAALGKGVVEVPLALVKKHRLVSFTYKGTDGPVPLLAYVTQSGNVVTAVGMSEPCHSTSFHIEGNELVCNLCATRWDLDTLRGASGDCAAYSMRILPHAVDKGRLTVKEAAVQNWKPRVLGG